MRGRSEMRFNQYHKNIQQLAITVLIAIISIICITAPVSADNHDVRDDAGVLNQQTQDYIKSVNDNQMAKIKGHPQIAVMTIKTTGDEPIEDYAQNVFDKYHFGTKGYDNGVLLLIATKDHKMRMQTGYGIESVLPDAYVDDLMSDQVKADFKKVTSQLELVKWLRKYQQKLWKTKTIFDQSQIYQTIKSLLIISIIYFYMLV